jgi:hypothetical protein
MGIIVNCLLGAYGLSLEGETLLGVYRQLRNRRSEQESPENS